jgi:aldose 1-epimerase
MQNDSQPAVTFLPLGAIIQHFFIGGHDVTLGFPRQEHYQTQSHPYFGETIGRIPNRISKGKILSLNGRDYDLVKNERESTTLHGGTIGWGKKIWNGPNLVTRKSEEVVQFTLLSADGDEGFPGQVEGRVWYHILQKTAGQRDCRGEEEVVLNVEYEIEMMGDEVDISETVCSMTNHAYWNLSGKPTVEGTDIVFASNTRLETDGEYKIPNGTLGVQPGVERNEPVTFTAQGPSIDECFVLDTDPSAVPLDTRGRDLRLCISAHNAGTNLHMEVKTTEPSFQFYSGDGINVAPVQVGGCHEEKAPHRGARSGFAVEPNRYVDAVNRPEWRRLVLLKRGQVWGCRNQFSVWRE